MPNFRLLDSIIKKKYLKVADPPKCNVDHAARIDGVCDIYTGTGVS